MAIGFLANNLLFIKIAFRFQSIRLDNLMTTIPNEKLFDEYNLNKGFPSF